VRRDLHKMHAFLRFRRTVAGRRAEHFVAWFEPDHFILDATARFFVDRFRSLRWSILTPQGSLHWDGETLARGPAARREDAPKSTISRPAGAAITRRPSTPPASTCARRRPRCRRSTGATCPRPPRSPS
jgi:probable DNA metabolism protein